MLWKDASEALVHRLVLNLQAPEKCGKDHTAFTMPGTIYCLSFDVGLEGMVEKFVKKGKNIKYEDFGVEIPDGANEDTIAKEADRVWSRFVEYYRDAIRSGSTVVDTGSEMWELLRLARFGVLNPKSGANRGSVWGPVNAEMRRLIREVYDHKHNVAFLHKMKDEWENYTTQAGKEQGRKTGKKEPKYFSDMPFLVQANVQLWKEGTDFFGQFLDCRQNAEVIGVPLPLTGAEDTWAQFGQLVYPDSQESEWK